ncbi:MAG TPA: class I SAM-dependent methyltransferase [Methanosarcina sp.]|nr:class I SAM-dependent methyltransferase [Methanosarcina sp.]
MLFLPICNYNGPFLSIRRTYDECPKCCSVERHRLQFLVFQELFKKYDTSKLSMLHVAPEKVFRRIFEENFLEYVTTDISKRRSVDYQADLRNLPFEDNTYDFVFASYVLEHIKEDEKAIIEIRRILKPEGVAILPVPIVSKKTIEYPEPNPYESYHVRASGQDYFKKYEKYFEKVVVFSSKDFPQEYQMCIHEDRSLFPNKKAPLREPMKGNEHDDFVPVCIL